MALGLERGPELPVVVDLAVADQPQAFVLVGHGLVAGRREVDDGKPGVAKGDAVLLAHQHVLEVGAAMAQRGDHAAQQRLKGDVAAGEVDGGDAAHGRSSPETCRFPCRGQNGASDSLSRGLIAGPGARDKAAPV